MQQELNLHDSKFGRVTAIKLDGGPPGGGGFPCENLHLSPPWTIGVQGGNRAVAMLRVVAKHFTTLARRAPNSPEQVDSKTRCSLACRRVNGL